MSSPWRPKLVEEGKPLFDGGNSHQDHSMTEQVAPTAQEHSHPAAPGPSSLAMAAGGTTFVPHISTKLVVEDHTASVESFEHDDNDSDAMACSPPRKAVHEPPPRKASPLRMRLVVGGDNQNQQETQYSHVTHPHHQQQQHNVGSSDAACHQHDNYSHETVERMQGVEHHGTKGPLVVMDGANIAYAYADALSGFHQGSKTEPDARGIQVAANYFLAMNVRVLVVIPAPWFRAKPRAGDEAQGNALMVTPHLEVLKDLKSRGLLVAAPPRDDDDAYALTIARREDTRSHTRGGGGGFVLSCDMFRDAVNRDASGQLREWLTKGSGNGPGRISFAFCDMGSTDDYGDREMDFVPNPRHPLVSWIESEHRKTSHI